jgi:hypothetical protein
MIRSMGISGGVSLIALRTCSESSMFMYLMKGIPKKAYALLMVYECYHSAFSLLLKGGDEGFPCLVKAVSA